MITADDLVRREVGHCVSSLVSTLAQSYECVTAADVAPRWQEMVRSNIKPLLSLTEQAFELASPAPDYEEAARDAGWLHGVLFSTMPDAIIYRTLSDEEKANVVPGGNREWVSAETWQEACEADDIEPYDREVFEHWIVSDWLADKLAEKGEKVDKDFAGLTVWARTTTGQSIAIDSVIESIVSDLNKAD